MENNLTNLRFANDIVLISNNAEHLQEMFNDLHRESLKVGLKCTRAKQELCSMIKHNLE